MSTFTAFSAELHTTPAKEESKALHGTYYWIDPGFTFYSSHDHDEIVEIERGYLSDGASVPKFLQWLIPAWGKHGQCAVLHDKLCETWATNKRKLNRKEVDEIFFDAMRVSKVNVFRRKAIELGVTAYRLYAKPTKPSPAALKAVFTAEYNKK